MWNNSWPMWHSKSSMEAQKRNTEAKITTMWETTAAQMNTFAEALDLISQS